LAIPAQWKERLAAPAIAAPMFLVSGPDLVVETCNSGIIGTFPALNQRTTEGYDEWLTEIEGRLDANAAPYGVNLIVHRSNPRLEADLAITVKRRVPLVITSLGAVKDLVDTVHSYGGLVFHDVINLHHARKAADAGVDGLIAVCAGAGGHAGLLNPFAFIEEIRAFFDKTLILSGAISTGRQVAAAELLGADFAYLGTRFICTKESLAPDEQRQMIVDATAKDIIYTPAISGVNANFLRPSIAAAGLDPENLPAHGHKLDMAGEARAWKNVWSAGQGVGSIHDVPAAADLCRTLAREYREARSGMTIAEATVA